MLRGARLLLEILLEAWLYRTKSALSPDASCCTEQWDASSDFRRERVLQYGLHGQHLGAQLDSSECTSIPSPIHLNTSLLGNCLWDSALLWEFWDLQ